MSFMTDNTLRYATRGLTGNIETDIAFLKEQIYEYSFDLRITAVLERILRCLTVPEAVYTVFIPADKYQFLPHSIHIMYSGIRTGISRISLEVIRLCTCRNCTFRNFSGESDIFCRINSCAI